MGTWDNPEKWKKEFEDDFNREEAPFKYDMVKGYDDPDDDRGNRKSEIRNTKKGWKIKKREIENRNKIGIYRCDILNELYNALDKDEELVQFVVEYKLGQKAYLEKLQGSQGLRNLKALPSSIYRGILTYLAFIDMRKKAKYANSIIAKYKAFIRSLNVDIENVPFQTYADWCKEHGYDLLKKLKSEKRYLGKKE